MTKETVADPVTPEGQPATPQDLNELTGREDQGKTDDRFGEEADNEKGVEHNNKDK